MLKSLATKIKMSKVTHSTLSEYSKLYSLPPLYPLTPANSEECVMLNRTNNISVDEAIYSTIQSLENVKDDFEDVKPFFVCDIGELKRQLRLWNNQLPFIQPFYAVKCNPQFQFLKHLINLNLDVGFDCASKHEIELVLEAHNELGKPVDKNNLIYANPIKPVNQLRFANFSDVNLTTVDSLEEIAKIRKETNSKMDVLVRIKTDDSTAVCPLSVKFGADVAYSKEIITECVKNGINIRGIAFHVGSGFKDSQTLIKAVQDSRILWDYINCIQINKCDTLDVGGGFSKDTFMKSSHILKEELFCKFGNEINNKEIRIISELGRFLAESCFTLTTKVIGLRKELDSNKIRLYLNDGLYGNLNCILYDHQIVNPVAVTSNGKFVFNKLNDFPNKNIYSIWGPTCDGLDCISSRCQLEFDVTHGDYIGFKNAGAYTNAAATTFNGFTNDFQYTFVDTENDI